MPGTGRQCSGLKILGLNGPAHCMIRLQDCGDLQSTDWPPQILRLKIYSGTWLLDSCGVYFFVPEFSLLSPIYYIRSWSRLRSSMPGPDPGVFSPGRTSPPKLMPQTRQQCRDPNDCSPPGPLQTLELTILSFLQSTTIPTATSRLIMHRCNLWHYCILLPAKIQDVR
jgi:hypothetical protein